MQRRMVGWVPMAVAAVFLCQSALHGQDLTVRLRRPVALSLSPDERWLYVANQGSGSLSVVDLQQKTTAMEFDVGRRLSDLIRIPGRSLWLATDEEAHELLLLDIQEHEVVVRQRLSVSRYPVALAVAPGGDRCFVASLWSRRVTIIELTPEEQPSLGAQKVIDVPLAPRKIALVGAPPQLLVADAFGGHLAILNPEQGTVAGVRSLPAHNIRGLDVSPDGNRLMVAHQILNELAHSVRNDVHWGLLMSNDLRWLSVDAVLNTSGSIFVKAHIHPLGSAGNATGDPSGLAVAADGTVVVTLGGVDEVAIGQEHEFSLGRVTVGKRPTAVTTSADSRFAYVANTFGDSISIVELKDRRAIDEISLGPQPELSLEEGGELLFYNARLSHDSWMSCHSCHTDGHTNGLLNDNLSDASFGAPKRILSLLGHADTAPFAWNGEVEDVEQQIRNSIAHTMQSDQAPREREVLALAAYLATLAAPPGIDLARGERDSAAVQRGRVLFESKRCVDCHTPPSYTSIGTYDVNLEDEKGNRQFNPPSLIGVSQRGPYFHDNRAATLEDVFETYGHRIDEPFPAGELADLLSFLRSL